MHMTVLAKWVKRAQCRYHKYAHRQNGIHAYYEPEGSGGLNAIYTRTNMEGSSEIRRAVAKPLAALERLKYMKVRERPMFEDDVDLVLEQPNEGLDCSEDPSKEGHRLVVSSRKGCSALEAEHFRWKTGVSIEEYEIEMPCGSTMPVGRKCHHLFTPWNTRRDCTGNLRPRDTRMGLCKIQHETIDLTKLTSIIDLTKLAAERNHNTHQRVEKADDEHTQTNTKQVRRKRKFDTTKSKKITEFMNVNENKSAEDENRKQKRESKNTEGAVSKQKKQRTMEEYYTEKISIEPTEVGDIHPIAHRTRRPQGQRLAIDQSQEEGPRATHKRVSESASEANEGSRNKIPKIAVAVAIPIHANTNTNMPTAIATRVLRIDEWVGIENLLRTPVSRGRGASNSIGMQLTITTSGLPKGSSSENL